jgi:hypothetical protein
MSILTEDGIYNDTYIDCTIVKDNIISLLIHDKKNSVTRSYKFESVEKAEELANKLLQVIFETTQPQSKHLSENENIFNAIKTKSLDFIGDKTASSWFLKEVTFDEQKDFALYLIYNGEHFSHSANKKVCSTLIDVYRRHHGLYIEKIYMLKPSGNVLSEEYFRSF